LDQRGRLGLGHAEVTGQRNGHVEYAEFSRTYSCDRSVVSTVAEESPACRSIWTATCGPERSTVARSAATPPARHTHTPLSATSNRSGAKAAPVVPTAARMRPQFGSAPNSAV